MQLCPGREQPAPSALLRRPVLLALTLPPLEQVHRRLSEPMEDPEPVMRQLIGVFLSGLLRVDVCPCSEEESPRPACRITQDRPLSLSMNSSAWAKFRAIFAL